MSGFTFKNEVFEGPLDLMLMLISKHKLDIRDIEISVLLTQFLLFLEENSDIEIAGEFLEAAARLIFIKTASLLPKHESEQLKKELEGALIEYALCKAAAERLRNIWIAADIFVREPTPPETDCTYRVNHDAAELAAALGSLSTRDKQDKRIPAVAEPLNITYISVFTKIVYVLKKLRKSGSLEMKTLFSDISRSERVALFLALLELTNNRRIRFSENLERIELKEAKT